jgi:hypothetical protein
VDPHHNESYRLSYLYLEPSAATRRKRFATAAAVLRLPGYELVSQLPLCSLDEEHSPGELRGEMQSRGEMRLPHEEQSRDEACSAHEERSPGVTQAGVRFGDEEQVAHGLQLPDEPLTAYQSYWADEPHWSALLDC